MKPALVLLTLCAASCSAPRTLDDVARIGSSDTWPGSAHLRPEPRAEPIEANWKERLAQPYVYVERTGDYRLLGDGMRQVLGAAAASGIEVTGAPFALFLDDPARVDANMLRARACLPVAELPRTLADGLAFDLLPRAMVVYARVRGAYPDVARTYPALFGYLRELGWRQGGPIREVYLVNPLEVRSCDQLLTEVQIPWIGGS